MNVLSIITIYIVVDILLFSTILTALYVFNKPLFERVIGVFRKPPSQEVDEDESLIEEFDIDDTSGEFLKNLQKEFIDEKRK